MRAKQITDLNRLCIHTITTKPWSIETAAQKYAKIGVKGISVWRNAVEGKNISRVASMLKNGGITVVSYVRGGFFASYNKKLRQKALDENRRIMDEAAELGAPLIVLVCGSDYRQSLEISRKQIVEGIAAVLPYAKERYIKLAIEPLHPMYADSRSAINTLNQANQICEQLSSDNVGVAVDVYHVWWDENLEKEIQKCAEMNKLFAFHMSDWKTPIIDMLNDRGLMGEGCIPIKKIRGWMEENHFTGFNEVEIFSNVYWSLNQDLFLKKIVKAYLEHC
ncbi:sugar phosphate isomerase/epimerase [bacterium]|nr:sugar phosphate isomerase/epimerase [bacterium]